MIRKPLSGKEFKAQMAHGNTVFHREAKDLSWNVEFHVLEYFPTFYFS